MKRIFSFLAFALLFFQTVRSDAQTTEIFGLTSNGGEYEQGTIYKTDGNGENFIGIHQFNLTDGGKPQGSMILAANGNLYGMTQNGGTYNKGVLFEFNPATNGYIVRVNFDSISTGGLPFGTLMQASDGKLYGMTTYGGAFGQGVLFAYDPGTETFEKKMDFDGTEKGSSPRGYLTQASNGKLYGMTEEGGLYNAGVLFSYDITNDLYTKLVDFDTNNGKHPFGSLVSASDGNLYGMTTYGGIANGGVIFKYSPNSGNGTFTKLMDLNSSTGITPFGALLEVSEGELYGLAFQGGNDGNGTLFTYNYLTGTFSKKIDFIDSLQGKKPYSSLMLASNGKLYGTTIYGGTNNKGVLFEYDYVNDMFTVKKNFNGYPDGNYPLDCPAEVYETSGTDDISGTYEYSIYPNPSTGIVTLDLGKNFSDLMVFIYNIKGETMQQFTNFTTPKVRIDIAGDKGIYFIEIKGKEGKSVVKILKE